MAYTPYATVSDYIDLGLTEFDDLENALRVASRHIDTLTFNRIVAIGFENLTEFQQDIVREVVCKQAWFEYENADEIASLLKGYSINGVSVDYGDTMGIVTLDGVTISRGNYSILEQTGLCCRLARHIWRRTQN